MRKTRVAAGLVKPGDVCVVDWDALEVGRPMPSQQRRIVVDVIRQGHGKVEVESVSGDRAHVFSHNNSMSRIVGGVDVPVAALEVVHSASMRIAVVARRIVSSEVVNEMIRQVRTFRSSPLRALGKALGGTWVPAPSWFVKEGDDAIVVQYRLLDDNVGLFPNSAGFRLKYDYGSDTYVFTPFVMFYDSGEKWGRESRDFYVDDLGDVSKLQYLFETAKP